jgi:hypothetical protein
MISYYFILNFQELKIRNFGKFKMKYFFSDLLIKKNIYLSII